MLKIESRVLEDWEKEILDLDPLNEEDFEFGDFFENENEGEKLKIIENLKEYEESEKIGMKIEGILNLHSQLKKKEEVFITQEVICKSGLKKANSVYDDKFEYKTGEEIVIEDFNSNQSQLCSNGIHFFILPSQAIHFITGKPVTELKIKFQ
jgi:hypothetical protein